jgi:hypothetical protein
MSRVVLQGDGFSIGFSDKEVTPWGGFSLLKQLLDQSGFRQSARKWGLPFPGSNRGYDPVQLIEQFIVSIWSGACRFSHTEMLRFDHPLSRLFQWEKVAERKAFTRFFGRFSQGTTEEVQANMFGWLNRMVSGFKTVTLDIDTTVLTRNGHQQGAVRGYNAKRRGRLSHHPLLAFVAETKMVANFWLRPGNTHTNNNLLSFLRSTLHHLGERTVGLIRADSGFFDNKVLSFLEGEHIDYVVASKLTRPLQGVLYSRRDWWVVAPGIELCEFSYRAFGWLRERRFIAVRQSVGVRKNAPGKNLKLFKDDPAISGWRYSLLVTSMRYSSEVVWRTYRGRADSENRIKELKADFGLDSFNMRDFWATEAALATAMLAYNLMSLFRQAVLRTRTQHTLSTLHGMLFAVGAYWDRKSSTKNHLLLCVSRRKRAWFTGLWSQASKPPEINQNP